MALASNSKALGIDQLETRPGSRARPSVGASSTQPERCTGEQRGNAAAATSSLLGDRTRSAGAASRECAGIAMVCGVGCWGSIAFIRYPLWPQVIDLGRRNVDDQFMT
jgi:hypothetical protein